ncbi:TMP-TENI-domain-containing protein [Wilcoxina mikolae CBS 423.85]|nr:TMP-TENI-domain-containing protein [Wilcoxina mikolae CBS 423.85]
MPKPTLDLSLYLVTNTELLPPGRTLVQHVEDALRGGVTIVQLREKTLGTRAFIELARKLHKLTQKYKVPLLINDRIDVALAIGCEGVHIGWDDMKYDDARRLLGEDKVIGVSVSDNSQAKKAAATGCDYIGVGPVFATNTKPDHNPELGTPGLRSLLEYISTLPGPTGSWGRSVPAVAIGGINLNNVSRVMYQSQSAEKHKQLDGVAVISAIIASPTPEAVCKKFINLLKSQHNPIFAPQQAFPSKVEDFSAEFKRISVEVARKKPMVHHITNNVVKNFSANVTIAVGASPIMSEDMSELSELAEYNGALVLNMGTSGKDARPLLLSAVTASNARGNPVIFDPVGAGATTLRKETTRLIVSSGYCDIIKGNESEIRTVFGDDSIRQRGIDSSSTSSSEDLLANARLVKALARRERNIIVMTGVVDYVSDGEHTFALSDGHFFQGDVTGTGCSLASVIAAYVANNRGLKLMAVLAAVSAYNAAARAAAESSDEAGPGTWQQVFLDKLYKLRAEEGADPESWVNRLGERVKKVDV